MPAERRSASSRHEDVLSVVGAWAGRQEYLRADRFDQYAHAIAEGRYIIRRIVRIVDEVAREQGLDPLTHQALVQVLGASDEPLTIGALAARLDIVPAFASRIANELEREGLVSRVRSTTDRRVIELVATEVGYRRAQAVDAEVHERSRSFQRTLNDEQRTAALLIFAFLIGVDEVPPQPG